MFGDDINICAHKIAEREGWICPKVGRIFFLVYYWVSFRKIEGSQGRGCKVIRIPSTAPGTTFSIGLPPSPATRQSLQDTVNLPSPTVRSGKNIFLNEGRSFLASSPPPPARAQAQPPASRSLACPRPALFPLCAFLGPLASGRRSRDGRRWLAGWRGARCVSETAALPFLPASAARRLCVCSSPASGDGGCVAKADRGGGEAGRWRGERRAGGEEAAGAGAQAGEAERAATQPGDRHLPVLSARPGPRQSAPASAAPRSHPAPASREPWQPCAGLHAQPGACPSVPSRSLRLLQAIACRRCRRR